MITTLFLILGLYFLYKLIFNFIIPIYVASKRMREQVRSFQSNMQQQGTSTAGPAPSSATREKQPQTVKGGEYIDFEEVK